MSFHTENAMSAVEVGTIDLTYDDTIQYILQSRVRLGEEEFQVFWRGYSPEEATWETRESLKGYVGYQKAIREYRNEQKQRKVAHLLYLRQKRVKQIADEKRKLLKAIKNLGSNLSALTITNDQ